MKPFSYEIHSRDGAARCGAFYTPHGILQTPVFAPVGTRATVKALTPAQLKELNATLVLANAYHLYLRPGDELVSSFGGVHQFMAWEGPMLTDSGGFQVFSHGDQRKVDEDGVTFRSHIDGSEHRFTPEKSIAIQENLGADIIMAFDECAVPDNRRYVENAMQRTHAWAVRCVNAKTRDDQALFGIVQGGIYPDLRRESADFITALNTPGIAIGGLSVGESKEEMAAMIETVVPRLPENKPRYLMGVGSPEDIVNGVIRGIDIFDCVLPTRMARNYAALTRLGQLNLRNAVFREDKRPIDPTCTCYTCRTFNRGYLRHLATTKEMLSATLISIHNLHTLIQLARDLQLAIQEQRIDAFSTEFLNNYQKHRPPEV
ncbi:MAG: tRNA guanosine(34) transglycosylase Tgt [Anaerolineales bacterium]|nr:tRNA guanosine(34) transglycosylase Tgt [Anaerolineales bacterium]